MKSSIATSLFFAVLAIAAPVNVKRAPMETSVACPGGEGGARSCSVTVDGGLPQSFALLPNEGLTCTDGKCEKTPGNPAINSSSSKAKRQVNVKRQVYTSTSSGDGGTNTVSGQVGDITHECTGKASENRTCKITRLTDGMTQNFQLPPNTGLTCQVTQCTQTANDSRICIAFGGSSNCSAVNKQRK